MYDRILEDIGSILSIDQQAVGERYLRNLAQNIASTLGIKYVLIGRSIPPLNEDIQTVVAWAGDGFVDNFVYSLKGTPCREVFTGNRVCIHDRGVAKLFPEDVLLEQMGVESYAGAPVIGAKGDVLGLLVLLDDKPIPDCAYFTALAEFGAGRAGAELERFVFHEEEAAFAIKLQDSERRFRAIFNQTYQYISILDIHGHLLEINQSAAEVAGVRQEDVIGEKVWKTPWWSHDTVLSQQIERAVDLAAHGEMKQLEGRHRTPDGEHVEVDVVVKPFVAQGGEVELLIVEAHDVTNIKKLEQKLIHSQKMEAVGTLAGGIAHDFNNILGGIMGYAELSQMENGLSDKLKSNLSGIVDACVRGNDLVGKMLTFCRQQVQEKRPIDISDVIEESVKLIRASIPTSIELNCDLRVQNGVINGDSTQLQQILINLCTNASHAIGDATGEIVISTRETWLGTETAAELGTVPGTHLALSVQDSGCGMPENVRSRIFDPFFTTKELGAGTGLGLSVVHGIVEGFGGAITVASKEGKGTTFKLFFPLLEGSMQKIGTPDEVLVPDGVDEARERILLVEDEVSLLEIGQAMLEKMEYNVAAYDNPLLALEAFESNPGSFSLVITDLSMPKLRGRDLAARIKQIAPETPVVAWTGYSESTTKESAKKIGFDDFLQKPARFEDLKKMIKRLLA